MLLGSAHNIDLNVAAETCLPGLAADLVVLLVILGLTIQTILKTHGLERTLAIGLLGSWVYLSTHMLVDNLYVNNTHLMIGALFALLVIIHAPNRTSIRALSSQTA